VLLVVGSYQGLELFVLELFARPFLLEHGLERGERQRRLLRRLNRGSRIRKQCLALDRGDDGEYDGITRRFRTRRSGVGCGVAANPPPPLLLFRQTL
jgi:hypothetical protein